MNHQIEALSTELLLKNMGLAVDEAKYVRQLMKTRDIAETLKREQHFSTRLIHLNREIDYLEEKLEEVRAKVKEIA